MAPLYPSFTPTYHHAQYPAIDPTQSALDCSDKIVLITGAGRGLGKGIALAFAQAHAKSIALLGRTRSTLDETAEEVKKVHAGTDVCVVEADITSQTSVQAAMDSIVSHYGNSVPDILVNNAGGMSGRGDLIDVNIEDFWKAFELNTKGPLIVSQAFLRANRMHNPPDTPRTLINIPSGAAHLPYAPTAASYATSKLASVKITEYLHYEHPSWNIFNLQPGVVDTDLARAAGRKAPDSPRLAAGMAVWLSTQGEEARWFNGKFLWANWDVTELLERKEEIREKDLLMMGLRGWGEKVVEVEATAEELMRRARSVHGDANKKEGG